MERSTLEVLWQTRNRLPGGDFYFRDWTACTCGHLYISSVGHRARDARAVAGRGSYHDPFYASVMIETADALGLFRHWWQRRTLRSAARKISSYTAHQNMDRRTSRWDAVAVIDKAIAAIEAREAQQRLALLDPAHDRELSA